MVNIISNTVQEYKGIRYSKCGVYFQNSHKEGQRRLHRVVYEDTYGKIEEGHHIHHIDHDVANNNPDNLCMITAREHHKRHWDEKTDEEKAKFTDHIEKGIEAAKEWHGTDAGTDWHKAHYESMKHKLHIKVELKCIMCGEDFMGSKGSRGKDKANRFCSNKCTAKHRRLSGVDDVERECIICDKKFMVNKYRKTEVCGLSCSAKLSHRKRREAKTMI